MNQEAMRFRRRARQGLRQPQDGAFSLLELLIVMALVVILYTMFYGGSSRSYQARKKAACEKNLQHIYVAQKTYTVDSNGAFPVVTNAPTSEPALSVLVPRYTTTTAFFLCPGSKDKPLPDAQPFASRKISYAYYMGRNISDGAGAALMSDAQVNTRPKAVSEQVFSPDGKKPGNNHHKYGGNFLFCDGSIHASKARSGFDLIFPSNVVLLNPRP